MSTPSPLPSQGTLEGASSPKSRVRITVLTILALHVVVIGGLLLQGCDKGGKPAAGGASNTVSALPPLVPDTNYFSGFPGDAGAATHAGTPPAQSAPGPAATPPPGFADSGAQPGVPAPAPAPAPGLASGGLPPITSVPPPGAAPAAAAQGTEHVIKKGDTIGALARKYGVTEQAIIDANPQSKPRNLKIDEKLVIPAPAPAAPGAAAAAHGAGGAMAAAPAAGAGEVYVVKQGDTLSKVAKKFGVTVKQLRAANNIKGDRIVPKQRLTIPARTSGAPATPAAGAAPAN